MEELHIYLTNLGNSDVYPLNTPSKFENRINPPIQLNAGGEYEIGLVNCLLPKTHLGIEKYDQNAKIDLWAQSENVKGKIDENNIVLYNVNNVRHIHRYIPQSDIEAGDIAHLVEIVNNEMLKVFRESKKISISRYLKKNKILSYDVKQKRVLLKKSADAEECFLGGEKCSLFITFGTKISEILGFSDFAYYKIYERRELGRSASIPAPYHPKPNAGVEFALIYTDCVERTRYGGQLSNILAALRLDGNSGEPYKTVYKPLSKTYLDEISIVIRDQKGQLINFGRGKTATLLVHIRSYE